MRWLQDVVNERCKQSHDVDLGGGGVEEALASILELGFSGEDIDWLKGQPVFAEASTAWWESLRHLRFSGDVYGMPEGSIAFAGEPLLRVTAPLSQAGLLETCLIQIISHATGVATRAARIVGAAGGVAFVLRRVGLNLEDGGAQGDPAGAVNDDDAIKGSRDPITAPQ